MLKGCNKNHKGSFINYILLHEIHARKYALQSVAIQQYGICST